MTGYKNLFEFAAELGTSLGSLYKGRTNEKKNVLAFMDTNGWFGVKYVMKDRTPWIIEEDLSKIHDSYVLWLSAYRKSGREKVAVLLKHFGNTFPEICRLYNEFIMGKNPSNDPAEWKLLDFLLSELTKDIQHLNENDIEQLIQQIEQSATRAVARLFSDFLSSAKINGKPLSQWRYSFNSRDNTMLRGDAYPIEDFSVMAYCVFNDDMWKRQGLLEKALSNKTYADLWLFVAFHFICALRSGDMERIPAPSLPYDGALIQKRIAAGTFKEGAALVDELRVRLKMKPITPSKTSAGENIPDIKLFIPESLRVPLGTIIAIALSHHPEIRPGDGFIKPFDRLSTMRNFFGEYFINAIGNRHFSSRRCNKSYLQGLELIGNNEPGKPKGYMLAALARSHKSGIGKLAETTEIYLRDARFSGYDPKFIVHQMFERGVFSFIPIALLEMYAGAEFIKLPLVYQTKLIGTLGLTAYQVEGVAEATERVLIRSKRSIADAIKSRLVIKENIGDVLQNIASGAAPGRQGGVLCLMTAAELSCPHPERGGCIGCGYEIYTKTAMYALMREYARLVSLMRDSENRDRYKKIIEQAIMPAATEMLASAKLLYPNKDISGLLDIMEVEINGVNGGTRGSERRLQQNNAHF